MINQLIKVSETVYYDVEYISEDFSEVRARFKLPYHCSKFGYLMNLKNPRTIKARQKFEEELINEVRDYFEALIEQYMEKNYGLCIEAKWKEHSLRILHNTIEVVTTFRLKEYKKKIKEDVVL